MAYPSISMQKSMATSYKNGKIYILQIKQEFNVLLFKGKSKKKKDSCCRLIWKISRNRSLWRGPTQVIQSIKTCHLAVRVSASLTYKAVP